MSLLSRNRLVGLLLAAVIFALDQWLKWFVVQRLYLTQIGDQYRLLPFFDLTRTNNYGISLGMLQATSMEMRWLLVLVTSAVALMVLIWLLRERKLWDIIPLAMVLGGALGNIYDRYALGFVIDYADFHIGTWRPFFIFNLADAAISIGVVIILLRALFIGEKQDNRDNERTADSAAGE